MATRLAQAVDIIRDDPHLNHLFKYNELTQLVEIKQNDIWKTSGNLNDTDLIQIKYYISVTRKIEYSINIVDEAINIIASGRSYNPIKIYLNSLEWDKNPRLDVWLHKICGTPMNEYTRDVGIKILCGAVKRVLEPGCKFDHMMILEGRQGIGKSTLVDILGGDWYLDTSFHSSDNRKDMIDSMRTAWIIEISDLAGFRKQEVESLKNFLSDRIDRVRLPYARHSKDFPRQCVFIGTHNPSGDNQYFKDDTGNRRFWCVECESIDLQLMREWRDQLFAEALARYKDTNLYLENDKSLGILKELHQQREFSTPLDQMIDEYLHGKDEVDNRDIIKEVFNQNPGQMTMRELVSKTSLIGRYMRKIRWEKGSNENRNMYYKPSNNGGGL